MFRREQQFIVHRTYLYILSQIGFGVRSRRFPRLLVEPSLWSTIQSWKKHYRLWSPQSVQRPVAIGCCYEHPDFSRCSYVAQWFMVFCNYIIFLGGPRMILSQISWLSTYDRHSIMSNYTVLYRDGPMALCGAGSQHILVWLAYLTRVVYNRVVCNRIKARQWANEPDYPRYFTPAFSGPKVRTWVFTRNLRVAIKRNSRSTRMFGVLHLYQICRGGQQLSSPPSAWFSQNVYNAIASYYMNRT